MYILFITRFSWSNVSRTKVGIWIPR